MKRLILAAAVLACACAPPAEKIDPPPAGTPVADAAGNRMEALSESAGRWCTGDGVWCVAIARGEAVISRGDQTFAPLTVGANAEVWPHIIRIGRNDGGAIVGLAARQEQTYSGGGGTSRDVLLFEAVPGQTDVVQATGFPWTGDISIRACFGEDDVAARREACSDEYSFIGTLTLDTSVASGPPRLVLTTEATTFPGRRSRDADSTTAPPLQEADLVRWRDETCSFRRVASRQGDGYVWDAVFPPCTDYLEP